MFLRRHRETVFQDARNAGYNTGITGWYNPYCRILPEVLDSCFWVFSQAAKNHMNSRSSARENLIVSFRRLSREAGRLHVEDFRELSQKADAMLHDNSLDFILLHMPVPHPYGIYNRATGSFATEHTSYINNLALADRYLAHVREVLERSGEWNPSAIIVMGDHSWRTQLLWLKHQRRSARIDSPFEAVKTRQLLDAIIENKITSAESLSAWTR